MRYIAVAIAALITQGCALTDYPVKFDSYPQAAMVYCGEEFKGWTPTVIGYDKSLIRANGSLDLGNCRAIWESGAQSQYYSSINTAGQSNVTTVIAYRPNTMIGIAQDMAAVEEDKVRREARRKAFLAALAEAKENSPCNSLNPKAACTLPIDPDAPVAK